MDEYKFVNVTKLVAALTYTANKIRAKLGISSKLDFDLEGETGFGDPVDDIQVGITPSGSIELTANGTYNVTEKASAIVAVPQPTGSVEITSNGTYDVTEKASAVVNVPSGGGITPSGTKEITITENGTTTEDVTNYANAQITVNVPSSGGASVDDYANRAWPSGEITLGSGVTSIGNYGFAYRTAVTRIHAPYVTTMGDNVFFGCSGLQEITKDDFPNLTTISSTLNPVIGMFGSCSSLRLIHFPKLKTLSVKGQWPSGQYAIGTSAIRPILVLPKITTFPNFRSYITHFAAIDLGPDVTTTKISGSGYFYEGYVDVLILRKADAIITAGDTNCIRRINANTKIYVPSALVSSYEQAANWRTKGSIFYPIEGSIYETQYADGTAIE